MGTPTLLTQLNGLLEVLEPDRAERLSWLADRIYHECNRDTEAA